MGGVQGEDLLQLGWQLADPGRGGTDEELFGDLAEGEEPFLGQRFSPAVPAAACPAGLMP